MAVDNGVKIPVMSMISCGLPVPDYRAERLVYFYIDENRPLTVWMKMGTSFDLACRFLIPANKASMKA